MESVEGKTTSIIKLIKDVDGDTVKIPEFQRNFVWEIGKTFDLFDSLVKDIFIGSLIYGVPSFDITIRELDKRPRTGKGSREKLKTTLYKEDQIEKLNKSGNFRLLLDGQQRITTLYRALYGNDEVWFIAKEDIRDKDVNDLSLEEILLEFSGHESDEHLSIKISDVFKMMQKSYRERDIKEKFFGKSAYFKSLSSLKEEQENAFDHYLIIKDKLQDLFKSEKVLSYYLLDTALEKFVLFFERSNSKGIQLNFIDILAAKLYQGFNLREKVEEFESKYNDEKKYKLNKEIVVRSISIINQQGVSRSSILKNLNYEHFNEHWDRVCERYTKSLNFLYNNHMLLAQSWMPYENMLIPLIIFLEKIGDDFSQMSESQNEFIKFWYWASIFAQRYTSASYEVIIQDCAMLTQIACEEKIKDRNYFYKLRSKVNSPDELHSYTKKASAVYKGVLNLVNYKTQGLLDWKSTTKLSPTQDSLDDHHIFPKAYLKEKYANNQDVLSLIDSVVNRTLIPKLTNVKIGKKKPSEYLSELKKHNRKLNHSLKSHLIPELIKGDYDDNYERFLEKRAKEIFSLIKENVDDKSIKKKFYQDSNSVDKKQIFATYYGRKIFADFYPETGVVIYKGKKYPSPSHAAKVARKSISGQEMAANGWKFWKFIDEQDQEKCIDVLRRDNQ